MVWLFLGGLGLKPADHALDCAPDYPQGLGCTVYGAVILHGLDYLALPIGCCVV